MAALHAYATPLTRACRTPLWWTPLRWFVPRACEILEHTGWLSGPPARHSTIHVEHLAEKLAGLAVRPPIAGGVRLASDPPRAMADVLGPYISPDGVQNQGTTREQAIAHPAGMGDRRWVHDVDLLSMDHFYSDSSAEPVASR